MKIVRPGHPGAGRVGNIPHQEQRAERFLPHGPQQMQDQVDQRQVDDLTLCAHKQTQQEG